MSVRFEGLDAVTDGKLEGQDGAGNTVTVNKKLLIDPGAQISCIDASNASNFKYTVEGGSATGAGGGSMQIGSCITMKFNREKADGSGEEETSCHLRFAIINASYSILGMDQLEHTGTDVFLSPKRKIGKLSETPS